jgi:type II secretory pathway pseudopilin PulG
VNKRKNLVIRETGFALATVLIVLAILAGVVFVVLDGQRAKLLQSTAVINASNLVQQSSNTHRACLSSARAVLAKGSNVQANWWSDTGGVVQANDGRWVNAMPFLTGSCLVEVLNDARDTESQWIPKLRITSRVMGAQGARLEQTEWRYPACSALLPNECVVLSNAVTIRNSTAKWLPVYHGGQPVLVAHRMY